MNHVQTADGSYRAIEMPGPRDLETWRKCFHVFKAAAVMLKIAHPAALERYESLFEQRCRRYPSAWHILVLADVRCRSEFFGAEKRRLKDLHYRCPAMSDYDPEMPWNSVIRSACEDLTYWHRAVDMPALEFSVGSKEPRGYQPGVSSSSASGMAVAMPQSDKRQKQEVPANWRSHNLKGQEICRKWNASPGGCEPTCPQQRSHQCAICLNTHRACNHGAEKGGGKGKTKTGGGSAAGPKKRARKSKKVQK